MPNAPRKPPREPRHPRLNLEIDPATKQRMDDLRVRTEAPSLVEVIRRALRLYEIVTDNQRDGGAVILRDADGSERGLMIL